MNEKRFNLGDTTVWLDRHLIVRDGQSIALQPKVSELLACLCDAAGSPVTREGLLRRLWGENASDDLLSNAVWKLRKALGDANQDQRRLIETIPKLGYRLTVAPDFGPNPVGVPSDRQSRNTGHLAVVALAIAALAFGVICIAVWRSGVLPPYVPDVHPVRVMNNLTGVSTGPSYSSDGKQLAYVSARDSYHTDLYLYSEATGESRQLTSDPGWNYRPAISPDGALLAAYRFLDGACSIELFEMATGNKLRSIACEQLDTRALSWSADSKYLLVSLRSRAYAQPAKLDPVTGKSSLIKALAFEEHHSYVAPTQSYEGTRLVVIEESGAGRERLVLSGGESAQSPYFRRIQALVWGPEDAYILFSGMSVDMTYGLWFWRPQAPDSIHFIRALDARNTQLSYVPSTGELALDKAFSTADLWMAHPFGDAGPERVAVTSRDERRAVISPSGTHIAYLAGWQDPGTIWVRRVEDGSLASLGLAPGLVSSMSWIDDEGLVVAIERNGNTDLIQVELNGVAVDLTTTLGRVSEPDVPVSGTRQYIYYIAGTGSRSRAWRLRRVDGKVTPLVLGPVLKLRATPDESWLYFTRPDSGGLWRSRVGEPLPELVAPELSRDDWGNFLVDNEGYVFLMRKAGRAVLVRRRHDDSGVTQEWPLKSAIAGGASLSASAAGDLLVRQYEQFAARIVVLKLD